MPNKRGKKHKLYHGYYSQAQWRLFFSNPKLRRYARKKAHATPGPPIVRYRMLPKRKSIKVAPRTRIGIHGRQ